MAQKAAPTAKVMRFLKSHLAAPPEEGAAVMIAVQSGEFKVKADSDKSDIMPEYKKNDRIGDEDKMTMLNVWNPALTPGVLTRMKKALYDGKKDEKVIQKAWSLATLEDPQGNLVTRSKSLMLEFYTHKRALMHSKPMVSLNSDFTIDWSQSNIFQLKGVSVVGDKSVYTKLLRKFYDLQVHRTNNTNPHQVV